MKRVTLADVAAHAGVSKATVSMVLNNNPKVAVATRARVRDSIAELGYVYNRAAASLRKQQSQAIGVIITDLTNPYFAEFAEGIQAEFDSQGTDVLLGVSGGDVSRQSRLLRSMAVRRVDGIALIPAPGTEASDLVVDSIPLLVLARRVPEWTGDFLGADNVGGAQRATAHLIEVHACQQLAFVGGLQDSTAHSERFEGFGHAVALAGMSALPPIECPHDRANARIAARKMLASEDFSRPDGVVCFNDAVALGVMDAAAEVGLRVGYDVRVIGFDDIDAAGNARPSLASVPIRAREAGTVAASHLLRRIAGDRAPLSEIVLPATVIGRESCGCPVPENESR